MILKCGNYNVMDLSDGTVFNPQLLPIESWSWADVVSFLDRRIYAQSNKIARRIDQRKSEQTAYRLGLSDAYWISFDTNEKFSEISPYYQEFGTLEFVSGFVDPTLRLNGSFDKEWVRFGDFTFIRKVESVLVARTEVIAGTLATKLQIGDVVSPIFGGEAGWDGIVFIKNLSSPDKMLLDFGSVLPPNSLSDGYYISAVQAMYSQVGFGSVSDYVLRVSLFDGVIGNEDRRHNAGNWGFYKSVDGGSVSLCPAYDFNMAYSLEAPEHLLRARVDSIKAEGFTKDALDYLAEWKPIVQEFCTRHGYTVWTTNLVNLIKLLSEVR